MKRFLSFLFACGAMSVFAAVTPVKHGEVNYIVENGKVVITGLSSSLVTDLIIPEKIGSLPVTKIAADAFELGERLVSVTIPASVTEIGEYAFNGCDQLEAVYISDLAAWCKIDFANEFANPLSIAGTLYVGSEVVTSVTIPGALKQVKPFTFVGCQTLKSVEIASGVTEIGESAFEGCGALETFKLPETVTTVGESAFAICDSLVEVTLPEGVKTVEDYAFWGCAGLTDVTLPVSLTEMGDAAFSSAAPESLTGAYLPSGMSPKNLTLVVVPEGITALPEDAFAGCKALTTVKMPSTVKTIGDYAFGGCSDLEQLSIPSSTTQIGEYAFYGVALTSVRIPAGVKTISEGAFYDCSNLTSVVIRNGVEQIEASAFEGCGKLAEVELPASVTSVGRDAFVDTAPAKMKFKGVPPTTVGADAFDATKGYYLSQHAEAWESVILNDKWNGLTMSADDIAWNEPAEVTTQINVVQVIFDANGGSGSKVSKRIVGTPLAAPTAPIREGYTFKGWTPAVPKTVPAANATYTAQWEQKPVELKKYLITFDANGGIGSQKSQQVEGAKLDVPTVTREGYTFKGWNPAVSENEKVPSKDTTYKAQWQVNQYTITFNANGGVGDKTVTQNYGTKLTAPKVTREGYTFVKWEPAVPATTPATNATYTAQWKLTTVDLRSLEVTENAKKKQATIKGCNQQISGYLEIPSEINGNTVVAIADGAFKGQTKLTKVTLPNTITSIGKDAFAGCSNLDVNAIVMPNQPKLKVGKGAFTGCKGTEVNAVPGEPLTSKQLGKAAGYKAATTASGLKVNAKTGEITATFKKSGTYEAVLFKPGATLKAIRIKVGDMPKLTIKMEGADAGCSVKGEGSYLMGKKVSLSAKASKEKIFVGFYYENGKELTTNMKYSYVMERENRTLTAKFKEEVITINTSALTSKTWKVGETVNVTIPVTAESGVKSVKAKLPTGLKLAKTKDGKWQVTGSPKKVGAYTVTFTVGTVQKKQKVANITMKVEAESVTINTAAVKNKTLNVGQTASGLMIGASATSGIKSVKASKLPSGMKVQQIKGVWQLTGAPKKAGMYNVTLTIMTKAGSKLTETFTLTVALIPEWAAKTFSGEVHNIWDDGNFDTSVIAQISVRSTGDVDGGIYFEDGSCALLDSTAKLLDSSANKVCLQLVVPWFDSDNKADGKVKTDLIIQNKNGTVTLDYRDSAKDSYVTGILSVTTK